MSAVSASALEAGRAAAEARMTDTCTIARVTPVRTNSSTGVITTSSETIYSGKCRVAVPDMAAATREAGGQQVVVQQFVVSVPISVTTVKPGDVVTVTAAPYDGALVNKTLRVRDVPYGSQLTARRLSCEDEQT